MKTILLHKKRNALLCRLFFGKKVLSTSRAKGFRCSFRLKWTINLSEAVAVRGPGSAPWTAPCIKMLRDASKYIFIIETNTCFHTWLSRSLAVGFSKTGIFAFQSSRVKVMWKPTRDDLSSIFSAGSMLKHLRKREEES